MRGKISFSEHSPHLVTEWHPEKNIGLSPETVSYGSAKKVWWKCSLCGEEWQATVNQRTYKKHLGCPQCGYNHGGKLHATPEKGESLADLYPHLISEWHPTKNGKLTPWDVRATTNKKIWWRCEKGHEWDARVSHRTKGVGCPYCAGQRAIKGLNDLASLRPDIAKQWHPTKNKTLKPEDVTVSSGQKVWWLCDACGFSWQSIIAGRTSKGSDCPNCRQERHVSFPEKAVFYYVKKAFPDTLASVKSDYFSWLGRYELDIFIPSLSVAIEYDGPMHSTKRDLIKNKLCFDNNIQLLRIRDPALENDKVGNATLFLLPSQSEKDLSFAIISVLEFLRVRSGTLFSIDIDLNKDRTEIYDLLGERKKSNSLSETNPRIAAEWHPTKNGALLPSQVLNGSNKKVWWQCSKGHEWQQRVSQRTRSNGNCPICSNQVLVKGSNDLETTNPMLAAQWHPTKNGELQPCDVFEGSRRSVWWQCAKGHEWQAAIYERNGRGDCCPFCSGRYPIPGETDLATTHPDIAAQWHPKKNGDLTPQNVKANSHHKVWWLGVCGHEWDAVISSRTSGCGCPICSNKRVLAGFNDLAFVNPKLASEWHPEKNGDLTPDQVTVGSGKKVWWKCSTCSYEWLASVYNRSHGKCGCAVCAKAKS